MNKSLAILLLIAILLPTMTKIGILIDFKINQDFIAEVLCINRDKPITTCYGNCFLADKLKKAEEKEQKQIPQNLKDKSELTYFNQSFDSIFLANLPYRADQQHASFYGQLYSFDIHSPIFHPPKVSTLI